MSKKQNVPTTNIPRTPEQQEPVRTTDRKATKLRLVQLEERVAPALA
jgi:hypothetical protein